MKTLMVVLGIVIALRAVLCLVRVLSMVSPGALWIEPDAVLARTWDMFWHFG